MHAAYIAGLDIGGTKIAATIADSSGPLVRVSAPTIKSGSERALAEQCIDLLKDACAKIDVSFDRINTIGVSSCGPFIKEDDLISLVPPNICGGITPHSDLPNNWKSIPLEKVLREKFPLVEIRNDCVAALAAERAFGNVQGEADCAYVTWSTGIGFGLCVGGNLLTGKNGNAGHAGHMLMTDQSDAQCGCGNFGDVEALISGRNLEQQFGRSAAELFDAARAGETMAQVIVANAARWFGRALFNVAVTLDIKVFLIGGSVWHHHGDWLAPLVMEELTSRMPVLTTDITLSGPGLDSYVADIGALYLVMPEEWYDEWRMQQPWHKLGTEED
jgi:glucokinase